MSSAATAQRSVIGMTRISVGSSDVSWRRSKPAGRPPSAATSNSAAIADWFAVRTTRALWANSVMGSHWRLRSETPPFSSTIALLHSFILSP
jgi:hypothetical protein